MPNAFWKLENSKFSPRFLINKSFQIIPNGKNIFTVTKQMNIGFPNCFHKNKIKENRFYQFCKEIDSYKLARENF